MQDTGYPSTGQALRQVGCRLRYRECLNGHNNSSKMVLFHGLPGTFMNYEALQGCRYEHGCEYFTYLPVRKVGTVFAIYRETCRFGV